MNLNALDNLLYKKKRNVLAHPLKPNIQHFAEKGENGDSKQQQAYARNLAIQV